MLLPVVLSEFIDSDDEKSHRGDIRDWLKCRKEFGNEMLDEMFDGDQNFIQHNFHSSNTIFSSFSNLAIG